MALSCLTWNNGKPCVWFDLKLNCCADPVDYVSSEGGLQVCRYHQYAVEGKTSEQGESPATDRQHTQAKMPSWGEVTVGVKFATRGERDVAADIYSTIARHFGCA